MIPFVKTEALGNDFILVRIEDAGAGEFYSSLAKRLCDRRLGIGADGLILWARPEGGTTVDVRIFNIDGSEAECSGNGLRCMAAYLFTGFGAPARVMLRTISGTYTLERDGDRYTADMGMPELDPAKIPFRAEGMAERIVDYALDVEGQTLRITSCATGNPHCSLFVRSIDSAFVNRVGPLLEHHEAFPNGTNVEFVHVINRTEIEVAFWERGAGRTPASGTGSCGATVASILNSHTDRKVTVHTENGDLEVEWGPDDRLRLTASATVVAEGQYLLA